MTWDAVVVGGGPNGLSAAIELARNGLKVLVREGATTVGGAVRSEALTLPGFVHDTGSAVYPLGVASPFFSSLDLESRGLDWVHPELPLAHPLPGGRSVSLQRSFDATVAALGGDGGAYQRLLGPFVRMWPSFVSHVLDSPLRPPRDPALMARFGLRAFRPTTMLAKRTFRTEEGRALLAGAAAHAGIPLEQTPGAGVAIVLMAAAHAVGWPFPRGGAGRLTDALAGVLTSLGGAIETSSVVESLDDLPPSRAVILDLTPKQVLAVAGARLPERYRRSLEGWVYGPSALKVDWALDGPIPWTSEACRRAGTVHVGGTLDEIVEAEAGAWRREGEGDLPTRPFVLLSQPSLFDDSRAPAGRHTAWAHCHVPHGWKLDMSVRVEAHVERFAPGFRKLIRARKIHTTPQLEEWNPNLVGGDITGGALNLRQTMARPVLSRTPWATPTEHLYLCSASTPPGGGVHGMCGFHAARTALKRSFGI